MAGKANFRAGIFRVAASIRLLISPKIPSVWLASDQRLAFSRESCKYSCVCFSVIPRFLPSISSMISPTRMPRSGLLSFLAAISSSACLLALAKASLKLPP